MSGVADHITNASDQHTKACVDNPGLLTQDGGDLASTYNEDFVKIVQNNPKTMPEGLGNAMTRRECNQRVGSAGRPHSAQSVSSRVRDSNNRRVISIKKPRPG